MPKSSLKRQELNQKKPYFAASVICLVLVLVAVGWFYKRVAEEKTNAVTKLETQLAPLLADESKLKKVMAQLTSAETEAEVYVGWMEDRFYWANLMSELRTALVTVEDRQEKALNTKTGVWIEKFTPVVCNAPNQPPGPWVGEQTLSGSSSSGASTDPAAAAAAAAPQVPAGGRPRRRGAPQTGSGGSICKVVLLCRAVSLTSAAPDANSRIAFDLEKELKSREDYFQTNGIALGTMTPDPQDVTFSFEITATLKRPMRL